MTTSTDADRTVPQGRPQLDRRPRRRQGAVLLLFAAVAFAGVALCVAGLGPAGDQPEGMLWFSLLVVGFCLLLTAAALLLVGLHLLLRPRPVLAGWFVDPEDPGSARWWDGRVWTEHTAPRSPAVIRLRPLSSSSRRRRLLGAALLLGGLAVALGSMAVVGATVGSTVPSDADGLDVPSIVALQLPVPALCAAVLGAYLLLTLRPDPRPGWYPDPLDAGRLRWWDGLGWSDATSEREAR